MRSRATIFGRASPPPAPPRPGRAESDSPRRRDRRPSPITDGYATGAANPKNRPTNTNFWSLFGHFRSPKYGLCMRGSVAFKPCQRDEPILAKCTVPSLNAIYIYMSYISSSPEDRGASVRRTRTDKAVDEDTATAA
eukprot:164927-Prorocentrum_minimum.AAC.1